MDDWDEDTLARALHGHLDAAIISCLKDQCVGGSSFLKLTANTLKLFNFPLGHILQICSVITKIQAGLLVLTDPKEGSSIESTGNAFSELDAEGDAILSEFLTDEYLCSLSDYEKKNFRGRCESWKNLNELGFSNSSRPSSPGVPAKYFKNSEITKPQPAKQMLQCVTKPSATRRSSRVQLIRPVVPEVHENENTSETDNESENAVEQNKENKRPAENSEITKPQPAKQMLQCVATPSATRRSSRVQLIRPVIPEVHENENTSETDNESENAVEQNKENKRPAEVRFKPANLPLSTEELKKIKPELPFYNVEEILSNDATTKEFVPDLKEGYLFHESIRKRILRTVVQEVCRKHTNNRSPDMLVKEGIARSIVVTYNQFQKLVNVEGKTPWSHIYGNNSGHIANIVKRLKVLTKRTTGNNVRKKRVEREGTSGDGGIDIAGLALIVPDRHHRSEILDGMDKTVQIRIQDRQKGLSITELLRKYPHFLSFKGEVISAEFRRLHPNAEDMPLNMQPLIPKVLEAFQDRRIDPVCKDETVKALMLIASKLPHHIGIRNSFPVEEELITVVQLGVDVAQFAENKRSRANRSVQPYLIAVKGTLTDDILQVFMVLDSFPMELGRIPVLRGVDWLFKAYVVFNVHYPVSWRQFFRFLQTCFYKVFIDGLDDVPASSASLYSRLLSL